MLTLNETVKQRRRGRPRFIPTQEQRAIVSSMRQEDYTFYAMAKRVGISIPTLKRAFRIELITHNPKLLANIAVNSYNMAMDGHVPSMKMWLSRYPSWQTKSAPSPKAPKAPKPGSQAWHAQRLFDAARRNGGKLLITLDLSNGIPEIAARIAEREREREAEERKAAWRAQCEAFAREDEEALRSSTPSE